MSRQSECRTIGRRRFAVRAAAAPVLEGLEHRALLSFGATVADNIITFSGDAASDTLALDVSAGLLRHNRFTAADSGFASNLDFDSSQEGEQAIPNDGAFALNINAGEGDDTLRLADGIGLSGGAFDGGDGNDTLDYSAYSTAVEVFPTEGLATGLGGLTNVENVTGGSGNDLIVRTGAVSSILIGGLGNDTLQGGDLADSLDGGAGDDTLFGWLGDDIVSGGDGNDSINGFSGNDSLAGGAGNDTMTGEAGNDTIAGNLGNDLMTGDGNNDLFLWNDGDGNDTIDGGGGSDTAQVSGTAFADTFTLGPGAPARVVLQRTTPSAVTLDLSIDLIVLNGGDGDDSLTVNATVICVIFDGAGGNDTLTINGSAMDETYTITGNAVSSVRGTVAQTAVERWTINALGGNDSIDASAASVAMTLYGGDGNDTLLGGPGNDSIVGGNGADSLAGNAGNDTLAGGAGTDTLAGGTGADTLSGDADNDQFIWTVGDGAETAVGGDGSDSMLIYGTADADTLTVGDGATSSATGTLSYLSIEAVLVDGNAGNDLIDASASSSGKTLSGGNGNDTLLGGGAADYLAGGDGDDSLLGGGGNDQLLGGDGNDFLDGNAGADNLAAGLGDDLLWLNSLEGPDTIDGQEGSDTLVCSLSGGDDNITLSPTQIVAGYAFTPAGIERVNFDGLAGNDSLSIQGTADADTFTIGDGVITGGGLVVGLAGLESLAIQAGAGDDQFEVQTTTLSTTLLGGDGDDAFVIPATGSGALTVNGQRGSDSYTVDLLALTSRLSVEDSGDVAAARRIRQAARAGKAMFALPDTDAVQISGTPADDDIVVNNAQLLIGQRTVDLGGGLDSLLVRGMGGNDTFRVLNSAIPLALQGNDGFDTFAIQAGVAASVQVNGGSGKGELIVNGSTRRDLMRVTDQRIISANGSTIRYLLVDSLTLNGAAGNDSFSLQNVATPTYVNGDGGDDVLVTDVLSHAIFNGGDQNDRLKIFGTQTNNNIRIGANAVNRGPTYDQIEAIDVLALGGNDYIDATDATIPVAINGGAGDDTIIGSAYDDLLDGAFGNDSIIGLGGDDRLYGREGSDILIGSAGDDLLWGGRGYDQIFSDAKDSINLGGAANSRNGGEVFDR